jgi:hypothetical protein
MRRSILAIAVLAFSIAAAGAGDAALICKDPKTGKITKCPPHAAAPAVTPGKPCRDPKTGKLVKCGAPAPMTMPMAGLLHHNPPPSGHGPAVAASHGGPIACKTGKPCGNACIPKDRICHK